MKFKDIVPIIGNRYIQIGIGDILTKKYMSTDEAEKQFADYDVTHIEARSHEEGMLLVIVKEIERK